MFRRLLISLSVFLLISLSACFSVTPSAPTPYLATVTQNPNPLPSLTPFGPGEQLTSSTLAPSTVTETATPTLGTSPTISPEPNPSLTSYRLDATLDYAAHTVSVDEIILYSNSTGVDLPAFVLAVEPNLWKNCFSLAGLMVNGQLISGLTPVGNSLDLPLPAPLPAGGSLNILLHYDLALPPADPLHVFGYSESQLNLVDWFPFIVPFSNGWVLHPPANVGEHLVYAASNFDVTIHLSGDTTSLVLAASTPAVQDTSGWHYHLGSARTFAVSASPFFHANSVYINGITLTSYYFESEKTPAEAALNEVAKAVSTYSSLFGPYPYTSLSMVESPYYDGMEYDGLFLLSQQYYRYLEDPLMNTLFDLAVHETAHQWWFGAVGSDQAFEPWLDEALATYSEELFYEKNYPEVTGWEQFRIDAYAPSGWVDTDIYDGHDFRTYANAVYLRGGLFLRDLRLRMGDEAFFAFLRDYYTQMSGKIATSADFFRILRLHTSADISDLLSAYFQNGYK